MDFVPHNRYGPLCILRGHRQIFLNYDVFLYLKAIFILANSADPGEMQDHAAFHLGLHCFKSTKNF